MAYVIFSLSVITIYIALTVLLYLQFGLTGIVNFGVVGFWGLGMYAQGVLVVQYDVPYLLALIAATLITGGIAYLLGLVILDLSPQAILVATLAFATIIFHLVTSEKWLTNGVVGLGTITFPIDIGRQSNMLFLGILIILTGLLIFYSGRLKKSPYGRLMMAIQDNERLARSLGKPTFQKKLVFFSFTSALMGMFGGLYASVYQFLAPELIAAGVTFSVWIALVVGGKKYILGAILGVIATVALFDFVIQTYLRLPNEIANLVPIVKLMLYGLTLMLVLMFRPLGILGERAKS